MNSDEAWKQWGEKDPYYGVLSEKKFRKTSLVDNLASFTQSGVEHWAQVRNICSTLFGIVPHGRAADFGCGVGRILSPMATDFEQIIGIDVSPHMIAEARKNIPRAEFILSDDNLSGLMGQLDFVHSYIVLQHIPPVRGLCFIQKLLARLAPGGIAALHVTLKRQTGAARRLVYFLKHNVPGARSVCNILQGKSIDEPVMQMNEYDLPEVVRIFEAAGMTRIHILPERAGETFGVMIYARKAEDG